MNGLLAYSVFALTVLLFLAMIELLPHLDNKRRVTLIVALLTLSIVAARFLVR